VIGDGQSLEALTMWANERDGLPAARENRPPSDVSGHLLRDERQHTT